MQDETASPARKHRAFFSYARADATLANWLWRALDRYRTPKSLVGQRGAFGVVAAKLHPIFRDKEDLSGGGALPDRLREALHDSDALIVLCTPTSATRPWVNEEVLEFQRLGRGDRVFPVIASTGPDDGERPIDDYLPPALKGSTLLAADLREIRKRAGRIVGDGREGGKLKLIAGLLGLPLDALARRERARQRLATGLYAGATTLFALLAVLAVGLAVVSVQALIRIEGTQRTIVDDEYARFERGYAEGGMRTLSQSIIESSARIQPFGLCMALYDIDGRPVGGDFDAAPPMPSSDRAERVEFRFELEGQPTVARGRIGRLLNGPVLFVAICEPEEASGLDRWATPLVRRWVTDRP
jgi:hypothetical protein